MRFRSFLLLMALGSATILSACAPSPGEQTSSGAAAMDNASRFSVLVMSKTAGFRHGAIPDGIAALKALGEQHDFTVDATEDASFFTPGHLAHYDVVVFLNTTQSILDEAQQQAFKSFIQSGKGFVGIHAATDTHYDWPWYAELVGAYFKSHPRNQTATVRVIDRDHPSTRHLPAEWERFDEWYNFREPIADNVRVLAVLDESTYEGGDMGYHPIAWAHEFDGGRSWYTGGGHTAESYAEPLFLQHLLGGLEWAAGLAD